jgi:hypothetical protein
MSESITIQGIEYVPSPAAARDVGLVADYVGRLCRMGKVRGIKIGSAWYADMASLNAYLIDQAYHKEVRRADLASERRHEYKIAQRSPQRTPILPDVQLAAVDTVHTLAESVGGGHMWSPPQLNSCTRSPH